MDSIFAVAPVVAAAAVVLLGAVGLLLPLRIADVVGVATTAPHGVSELRAVFGGTLGSIGLVCLITREPAAFLVGAAAFFGGAVAKLLSLVLDRPDPGKLVPSLILDVVVASALLAGHSAAG